MRSSVTAIVCILVWLVIIGAVVGFLLWKKRLGSKASGRYSVNDIQGPEKLIDGEEVVLICTATDCPEIPQVKWFEKGEVGSFEILEPPDGGHDESKQLQTRNYVIKKKPEGFRDFSTSLRFKFCFRRHNGLTFVCKFIDSKGTKEKSFQCRSVYAKPQLDGPIKASLCISGEVVCCVSLKKFYPKQIKVGWRCEPEDPLTKLIPKEIFQQNSDFTVNVLSEVRIPRDFFTDPKRELRVTWKHESLETPGSCELSARSPDYPWKPVVREIKTPKLFHGLPVTLVCEISKYFPDSVTVDWLVKRNDGQEDVCDEESISVTKSQNEDFTSSCTSGLTVTPRLAVHQGVEYICRVWHPSLETPTERRTGKLRIVAKPCMKEPIKATLEESSRISFSLNLQNVYPRDINITWNNDIKASKPLLESTGNPMGSEDLTFNVTSSYSILGTIFETPQDQVTVKWEHESLDAPESASLCVRDFPWRPQMEDIQIPKVEADKKTALRCGISGYFPDKLSVRWYKRQTDSEMELPRDKYDVSAKSAKQSDKTYRCESSMKFTPHLGQDQGVEFICRVSHPTLEQPIEKTTGPLSIAYGGKPNVSDIKLRNGLLTLEVNNFYPRDIQISWRVKPESADKYEVLGTPAGEVTENKDGTFRVTSTCEHPSNEKGRPCVVVAVVTHKSLKTPEEKKFQLK